MLKVMNLEKRFRGLVAVKNLSFEIKEGEVVGLIGPNGAGKTTVFNLITGIFPPTNGRVVFGGLEITSKKPSEIAALGLARTFQANVLFDNQTSFENIVIASHLQYNSGFLDLVFGIRTTQRSDEQILRRAEELLDLMGLKSVKDQLAESLPQGLKRILGVCNALATNPKLLLLDEPLTGMTNKDIQTFKILLERIRNQGITILVVEHNLRVVMEICERIIVINFGNKIAEGTPEEIRSNDDVIEAYIGG